MKQAVQILRPEEMKFVQTINLVAENRNQIEITAGYLLYERPISKEYTMKEKDKSNDDFMYSSTYPRQEDHPFDDVEALILEGVKSISPKSTVHSLFLFSSADVEYIERLKSRPFEEALFTIQPNFSGIEIETLRGQQINFFRRNINIYQNSSLELIKNLGFTGYCGFENREETFDRLSEVSFL